MPQMPRVCMHVCIYACMCICVCVSTWVRGTWNEPEIPYLLVLLMRRVRKGRLGWAVLCRAVSGQGGDDDDTSLLSEEFFFFGFVFSSVHKTKACTYIPTW